MHLRRIVVIVISSGGVGLGCLSLLGCGDESKTSGTQVQLTPGDKEFIKNMRGTMKQQRVEAKQARIEDRKKGM